jgi:putative polyketide hydroxylase
VSDTPVLICGAGPVGLTASILLSDLGVRNIVVEKRAGTTEFPRARGMNCRTVEIWRGAGLEEALRGISLPAEWTTCMVYMTTLDGEEIGRMPSRSMSQDTTAEVSPAPFLSSSQDRLDALLAAAASNRGAAEIRFDSELVGTEDDGSGVIAEIARKDGRRYSVRADWLIAADGANSGIRQRAGIELIGRKTNRWYLSCRFDADLSPWTTGREGALIWTLEPGLEGVFQPLDGQRDWNCGVLFDASVDPPDAFSADRVLSLIRRMIGSAGADVEIELHNFRPWFVSATIASRLRSGKTFLVGDAAHQIPPFGGMGMNTGVQDAHNLAWKLAAVIDGWGDDRILDSYDVERREVAARVCRYAALNMRYVAEIRAQPFADRVAASRGYGNWGGLDVGVHYEQGALVDDGTPRVEVANPITDYVPDTRPGERAPHRWLRDRDGRRVSTIDLFERELVLLVGDEGAAWPRAAREMATRRAVPVKVVRVGASGDFVDETGDFAGAYGIHDGGAVLVRPDGHVAFRVGHLPQDPLGMLQDACDQVLGTGTAPRDSAGVRA